MIDESSLAAKKRRKHRTSNRPTSSPKNRVWGFEESTTGRLCCEPDLSWETAAGSVQYSYENVSGRAEFISRDPLSGAEFSQGTNLYAYCRNNFMNLSDPTGMCFKLNLAQGLQDIDNAFNDFEGNNQINPSPGFDNASSLLTAAGLATGVADDAPLSIGNGVADLGDVAHALGAAGLGAGFALDAYGVATGQESVGQAALNTGMSALSFAGPEGMAASTAYGGFQLGQSMQNIPTGGGSTVGSSITNAAANWAAPLFAPSDPSTMGDF